MISPLPLIIIVTIFYGILGRLPGRTGQTGFDLLRRRTFLSWLPQCGPRTPLSSGYRELSGRCGMLTTHLHLVPTARKEWSYTSTWRRNLKLYYSAISLHFNLLLIITAEIVQITKFLTTYLHLPFRCFHFR